MVGFREPSVVAGPTGRPVHDMMRFSEVKDSCADSLRGRPGPPPGWAAGGTDGLSDPGSQRSSPPGRRAGPVLVPSASFPAHERHLSSPQPPPAFLGCSFAGRGKAGAAGRPRAPRTGSAGGCRSGAAVPEQSAPGRQHAG